MVDHFHRQAHLATIVKADQLDLHAVAFFDDIGGVFHPMVSQLRNMHQPVALAEEIDKSAKIHRLDDRAFVNHADFRLSHNGVDLVERRFNRRRISRRNFDEAVIANINFGT